MNLQTFLLNAPMEDDLKKIFLIYLFSFLSAGELSQLGNNKGLYSLKLGLSKIEVPHITVLTSEDFCMFCIFLHRF